MPELPEVETIKRGLTSLILHKKIVKVEILTDKSFIGDFTSGAVVNLRRLGKAMIIDLDNGLSLMVHLRMTGQLIFDGLERFAGGHPNENFVASLPNKQTRVILELDTGEKLFFNDQRKFGFIKVLKTSEVENDDFIRKLAKEPDFMTADELWKNLMRHKSTIIKAAILDQSVVAGLGNIYADESLYKAQIHPARKVASLDKAEISRLFTCMREVMQKSIDAGGSTIRNYVKADGTRGNYLDLFAKVYGRAGEPCEKCGTPIQKVKLAGRGTHFCPHCQRLKP